MFHSRNFVRFDSEEKCWTSEKRALQVYLEVHSRSLKMIKKLNDIFHEEEHKDFSISRKRYEVESSMSV